MIGILLCFVGGPLCDSCDVWERNTVRCPSGEVQLVQHVWWSMDRKVGDYVVRDWRLDKDVPCQPERTESGVLGIFRDGKDGRRRAIRARVYLESETTVDHETIDRQRVPTERRRELSK